MRRIAILSMLALTACGQVRRSFPATSTSPSPISITECIVTRMDRTENSVTRQTTADEGRTTMLTGGHRVASEVIQWMPWVKEDSSVEFRTRWWTDEMRQVLHGCTGQQPLPL
jgi:hypothetical protein